MANCRLEPRRTDHDLDASTFLTWIGREEAGSDRLSPDLLRRSVATFELDPVDPRPGTPAPLGIHRCLAPPAVPTASLGPDGHPRRAGFLPPIPLPRRMWAGESLNFGRPMRVGDEVKRQTLIADVAVNVWPAPSASGFSGLA